MAKKKYDRPAREVTRRQQSHWERESKRQRIILISGLAVIAVTILVMTGGWFVSQYLPMRETVVQVNDTKFDMAYFIKMLQYYGKGQNSVQLESSAEQVVKNIQLTELVRQTAAKLGITATDAEISAELKARNLTKDQWDLGRLQVLSTKLRDGYFDQTVPKTAEQRRIMAMLLESEEQAADVKARLDKGEDFGTLAGQLSGDATTKEKSGDLGWQAQDVLALKIGTTVVGDKAFTRDAGMLSEPLYDPDVTKKGGYWLIEVLDNQGPAPTVQAILLGSSVEAQKVKDRLSAGEDFGAVAKEVSQLPGAKDDSGYLGPVAKGQTTKALESVAFDPNVQLNEVIGPVMDEEISTKGGYWLINVVEIAKDKTIEDSDRTLLKNQAFNEWLTVIQADPQNVLKSFLDADKLALAVEEASAGQASLSLPTGGGTGQ